MASLSDTTIDSQPVLPARFWAKVMKTRHCWNWTGGLSDGYGLFWWHGSTVAAHRLAYRALVGEIPDGLELDHECRNRRCVRPDHLRVISHRGNVLAGRNFTAENARKVCCPHGHEYATVPRNDGTTRVQRKCLECVRLKGAADRRAARMARWDALWRAAGC